MFCYEVSLTVEPAVTERFEQWLPGHIERVVEVGSFLGADWWKLVEAESGPSIVVRYYSKEREAIDRYVREKAPALRAEAIDEFGERFRATRRIYQLREIF